MTDTMTAGDLATTTVLLVEDDPDIVDLIETVIALKTAPIELVGVCRNGAEVIDVAGRVKPDVVLLDLELPGGSGLAVLRELPRVCPEASIVVHSAYVALYTDHLDGADDIIAKGTGIRDLPGRLATAAARRSAQN